MMRLWTESFTRRVRKKKTLFPRSDQYYRILCVTVLDQSPESIIATSFQDKTCASGAHVLRNDCTVQVLWSSVSLGSVSPFHEGLLVIMQKKSRSTPEIVLFELTQTQISHEQDPFHNSCRCATCHARKGRALDVNISDRVLSCFSVDARLRSYMSLCLCPCLFLLKSDHSTESCRGNAGNSMDELHSSIHARRR